VLGSEGIMIFLLFFVPAAVCFTIYEVMKNRLGGKQSEEAAFSFDID
jgi:hypothetical protein